jgi:hypothetical protein
VRKVDPARQSVAFYPSLEVALRLAWRLCCATLWKRTDASRHGFGARHSKRHRGETRAYVIPQIHFRKPLVVFRNRCRPSQTQPPRDVRHRAFAQKHARGGVFPGEVYA